VETQNIDKPATVAVGKNIEQISAPSDFMRVAEQLNSSLDGEQTKLLNLLLGYLWSEMRKANRNTEMALALLPGLEKTTVGLMLMPTEGNA
jgi:hypothetical protein